MLFNIDGQSYIVDFEHRYTSKPKTVKTRIEDEVEKTTKVQVTTKRLVKPRTTAFLYLFDATSKERTPIAKATVKCNKGDHPNKKDGRRFAIVKLFDQNKSKILSGDLFTPFTHREVRTKFFKQYYEQTNPAHSHGEVA